MLYICIFLVSLASAHANYERYNGYKLYDVRAETPNQRKIIAEAEVTFAGADLWDRPEESRVGRIVVPSHQQGPFAGALRDAGIQYNVSDHDVELLLKREHSLNRRHHSKPCNITYDCYPRLKEINAYLDRLAATHPNKVKVLVGEKSFEGREIKYLKISSSGFEDANNPVIFIDAGIHAREWISHMTALFIIDRLIKSDSDLPKNVDWIIMPVVNPDGYEFTHTQDRFWRKTRSTGHGVCSGVDGNRNFEFKWMSGGSSSNPCDETFAGPKPFSEPETRNVRDILLANRDRIKLFITIHSYGSMLLYPWGYTSKPARNDEQLNRVARLAAKAIESAAPPSAPKYRVHSTSGFYINSGGSNDHGHSLGIPLNYVIELPRSRKNKMRYFGFVVPPEEIKQMVGETWQGIVVFAREVAKVYANVS